MRSIDAVGSTFADTVLGQGILNGNVNLSFGQFLFTPNAESGEIVPDLVVCARLRMPLVCAKQLRDSLINLIDQVEATAEVPEEKVN